MKNRQIAREMASRLVDTDQKEAYRHLVSLIEQVCNLKDTQHAREGNGGKKPRTDVRIKKYRGRQCIVFPSITGEEFAVWPHYRQLPLIELGKIGEYRAKSCSENDALYDTDCSSRTDELIAAGSPAAKYARAIGFDIPTLGVLVGMLYHSAEINSLAKEIDGDVIDKTYRCSSSRRSTFKVWGHRNSGSCGEFELNIPFTVSPVLAFKK